MNTSVEQRSANGQPTDPRVSALASASHHDSTLILLGPDASAQAAFAAAAGTPRPGFPIHSTATARSTPSLAGSSIFAASQDPSRHFGQLPLETPYFTPQATWTETSRSDYFSATSTSIASGIQPSQANLFTSGLSVPAQTPAAIEIPSFSASSPSYFPNPTGGSDQELQGFQLPSTGAASGSWEPHRNGSVTSLSSQRSGLSLSMPLSSLMSPTGSGPSHRLSMSALSQSHHSPTAAAVPAELKIQEIQCETVSSLLAQVLSTLDGSDNGDRNAIMLLDMRPSVLYATSTIKTAVNLCISSILLKRQTYSLQSVTGQLTTEQDIEIFSRWRQFSNIVFFDASGSAPVVGSPTFFMAQKFRREGCTATLAYLHGGFNKFSTQFSDQCRADEAPGSGGSPQILTMSGSGLSSSAPSSATGTAAPGIGGPLPPASTSSNPRQRLHLGALPSLMTQPPVGPLGCQTPMIENPNINPLFENVRQAMGLSTNITEEIPVRLPMGFTVQTMQDHLPRWLQCAIAEGSGKTRLAEFFQKVEISENKRLALLMLPQNMRSGRTSNFSIGAGIEQGLKNRYHNIWPYDHTRVKIAEVEEGHDDYINASFLTPLLSKKTYIATQGPLPSTFQDFWKSTWEQNSRVVVMLTREQEMGRIKCHEYWPSPKQPVMEVGSMRVVFINEFLPDPTIGTILVRQLKLSLKNHPESEERNITQIQYTGWPDFGVPETPLEVLRVVQLANEYNVPLATAGPMVVHCSAGCGRTGAFCVIDSILSELQERPESVMQPNIALAPTLTASASKHRLSLSSKPSLEFARSGNDRVMNAMANSIGAGKSSQGSSTSPTSTTGPFSGDDILSDIVYSSVSMFREQRISMVQTLRQYVFCYEAIYWHLAREYAKERPALGLVVIPPPSMAVHTPLLPIPPNTGNPAMSMGNAPNTTTNEEFSFFG